MAADERTPLRLVRLTMPERGLLVEMTRQADVTLAGHKLRAADVLVAVGLAERCDRGGVNRACVTDRGRAWLTRWDSADRRLLAAVQSIAEELRAQTRERKGRGDL